MEHEWERTFPFLEIDINKVRSLFKDVLEEEYIINVVPINEGCRTTNYIVESNEAGKKFILKIFFSTEQNHRKEVRLSTQLTRSKRLPVPKVYKCSTHKLIQDREYAIYEYIEGKTLGKAIKEGYILEENFVREIARSLAKVHSYKFDKVGFLDDNLGIIKELPPLISWYSNLIGDRAKRRLGTDIIDKIRLIATQNEKILSKLDEDIRLVHGDFQGTNILIKDYNLVGILDWEFAMAGHPLADIGQFFRYEEYFNGNLIRIFEEEYNKNSDYKLIDDWYKISKLRDLINLIQLIDTKEDMPNKHTNIKAIIASVIRQF